jgi:hypothetical protein
MENDFSLVRRCLIPADAFILCGCLRAAGLNATVMDDQHVQAALLLAPAIGGARVMVPNSELALALEVMAAFERGELALDEDDDVGGARVYEFTPRK